MPEWKQEIGRRLANLKLEPTREAAIIEELAQHLEDCYEELRASGATPAEAERRTLAEVRESETLQRELRRVERQVAQEPNALRTNRRGKMFANIWQDLRYGARVLVKQPGFTLIAVFTLALGIGANTAIFSLLNAVLLNPLPYQEPERLVMVWEEASSLGFPKHNPAAANYADWKAQSRSFAGMAALSTRGFNLTTDGEPEQLFAYGVTADFFPLLGAHPALGRTLTDDDDRPDAPRAVVISHRLWETRYGGDRSIIGRSILLDETPYTVVGVMPAGFQFLTSYTNAWVASGFTPEDLKRRGVHSLIVVARLNPGVTVAQAGAEIKTITARIARDYPVEAGHLGAFVEPLRDQLAGHLRRPLLTLFVATLFVLLIACANLANLLLGRAAVRSHEMSVRAALGAGRARLMRQMLSESLLLAGAGAALGVLLALWSFRFLQQSIPASISQSVRLQFDGRVMGFTLLATALTGLLFGLVPALQASKADLTEALRHGAGRSGFGSGRRWLRNGFIVAEVALALVLLTGAGLLIQTLGRLQRQYAGFRPEQLLTARTSLPPKKYEQHERRVAFYSQALERVQALPGVTAAGYTTSVPFGWKGGSVGVTAEGKTARPGEVNDALFRQVSEGYLQALGMPLRAGRFLEAHDTLDAMPVALINETLARRHWPNESAVGKRFKFDLPPQKLTPQKLTPQKLTPQKLTWITVAGVVADVRQMSVDAPVKAEVYVSYRQANYLPWLAPRDLVVRTTGAPATFAAAVRQAVQAVDPTQSVAAVHTFDEILGGEIGARRLVTWVLSAFALLALSLALLGIYGVLSYFVRRHTLEIGVRLALGATARDIVALVMRKGMGLTLIGIVIGLAASLALTRLMRGLLFEIEATDPATFGGVALSVLLVALLACWIPARRATKVDPLVALRCE